MHLPFNIAATTEAAKALNGASFILHAIPVQASFEYLHGLKDLIPPNVPIINTSKGLHTEKLMLMSDIIPAALERNQPFACLSGPTFAMELMKVRSFDARAK
jgi:glycerol-3-phosphate dehydrogenase